MNIKKMVIYTIIALLYITADAVTPGVPLGSPLFPIFVAVIEVFKGGRNEG